MEEATHRGSGSDRFRRLTKDQVETFHRDGYLGPFDVWSESEMENYRKYVIHEVLDSENPQEGIPPQYYRHVDDQVVYEMSTNESIVEILGDLYGRDLLLWSTKFWNKTPGTAEIPWHQHYYHMPLQPKLSVTAWIALTEATVENGCLELIPGSHQRAFPQVESPEDKSFEEMTDPDHVDEERAEPVELDPGDVLFFTERTLHRSSVNTTDTPRLAMSMRVTLPFVHIDQRELGEAGQSTVTVLDGEDWAKINDTATFPVDL